VTGVTSGAGDGDRHRRAGAAGLLSVALSLACFLLTALLGPSAMEPALPGSAGQPPFSLVAHPGASTVICLVAAGIVLGALGVGLCVGALRGGWRVPVRPLLIAGGLVAVAFMLMPPIGSADHLNYAAYGRMVVTGHDPYTTTAADLPGDPVARAVQEWRTTPSVYGPLATGQEALASWIGGRSVRLTVFILSVTNAIAFLAAGLALHRAFRGRPERQLRAALLWTLNPLVLLTLMAGAHIDVISIAFVVAGLAVYGRGSGRPFAAGVLIAFGALVKINVLIVAGGPACALLRRPGRLAGFLAGIGLVLAVGYAAAGSAAVRVLHAASLRVALSTPWHLVDVAIGRGEHRSLLQYAQGLLTVALVAALLRVLPRGGGGDSGANTGGGGDSGANKGKDDGRRVAVALALGWLFATAYALPWYDGLGWALLAFMPSSALDWLLVARTTLLSLAYLPARDYLIAGVPAGDEWLITVIRSQVVPWTLLAVLACLVAVCLWRRRDPARSPEHSPPAPAESPR
jgi:hypothetical protein